MYEHKENTPSNEVNDENRLIRPEAVTPSAEEFQPLPDAIGAELQQKKKPLFILIPLIIAGVLLLFSVYSKWLNFYQRSIWGLSFDYRCGELASQSQILEQPIAQKLADTIPTDCTTSIRATEYFFSIDGKISEVISKYVYTASPTSDTLNIKTGSKGSFLTKSDQYRKNADGSIEEKHGLKWTDSEEVMQNLYGFFFAVQSDGDYQLEYHDTHTTKLEDESYDCEIWLMTHTVYNITTYYTIYRYYQQNELKAVRILNNYNDSMQIFDIESYQFS